MKKEASMPDFIKIDHEILELWKEINAFEKLVEKNKNAPVYRALDGPITANNRMGIHHVWGRTLKDIYLKYKAMSGYSPKFQNGFDAHGLPVEVEVEKQLGIKNKKDIQEYGVANFVEECIKRVDKYSNILTEQSIRMGQWMDWDNSYYTNSDTNITSIWHFLKEVNNKGWLQPSHKPMQYCPRCATSLSEHELHGNYKEIEHTAVYFKAPIKNTNMSMLVWTTTPWTLTSNVAIAVNPENTYVEVKVKSDTRHIVLGKEALKVLLKDDKIEVVREFLGSELVGMQYETCFPNVEEQNFDHYIVEWDEVSATDGSGAVHIAPGCGKEDFELGKKLGLKAICPIDDNGIILPGYGKMTGLNTDEVKFVVFELLEADNKMYYTHKLTHSYPICWRCKNEIVFRLIDSWVIKVDEVRPQLLEAIKTVEWDPEFLQKRMEDWLVNMGDWNISRSRFYGVPLPIYITEKGETIVVGSLEELRELAVDKELVDNLPHLHRPYIDEVKIKSPVTGDIATRILDVGDTWLDAGITPFSTNEYFTNREVWEKNFPAEVVIEMREQIRLWFYSLLLMSVVLTGKAPYQKVVGHESVVKEDGGMFSKSGYSIDATDFAEKLGVDPARYMYAQAPTTNIIRFGYGLGEDARRKLLGFWNSYTFFNTYAVIDEPDLVNFKPDENDLTVTDKWLLQITNDFIKNSKQNYDTQKSYNITKDFEVIIDEISNFYIRTNRRRFWKNDGERDKMTAYWVLYESLKAIALVMAPILPFMSERIWQGMVREVDKSAPESIFLQDFPTSVWDKEYSEFINYATHVKNVITMSQRLRNENQLKVKQPLGKVFVVSENPEVSKAIDVFETLLKDELNVKEIINTTDGEQFNNYYLTVNFKTAGAVLKGEVQQLKSYLESLTDKEWESVMKDYENNNITFDNFGSLDASLFVKNTKPKAEFVLASEYQITVVLDTTLNEELIAEGLLRELMRNAQVLRKDADFNIESRVLASIRSNDAELQNVILKYSDKIKEEILASELNQGDFVPDIEKEVLVSDYTAIIALKSL